MGFNSGFKGLNALIGMLCCTQTRSVLYGCNYIRLVLLSLYNLRQCKARSSKSLPPAVLPSNPN